MPLRKVRMFIMAGGIVILIAYWIYDYWADPVRELELSRQAMVEDFGADTVERHVDALIALGRYEEASGWIVALASQPTTDPDQARKLATFFADWGEQRSDLGVEFRLEVALAAYITLAAFPSLASQRDEWRPRIDEWTTLTIEKDLDEGRPIQAWERLEQTAARCPESTAVSALRDRVVQAARFALQDRINTAVHRRRWEEAWDAAQLLERLDERDAILLLHRSTILEALIESRREQGDVDGAQRAEERLRDVQPEGPASPRVPSGG
ncbi:MAG: hypothetical protein KDC38_04995 [Planctomycetes bacterium]|nr:hypothetical protein [Planctomycetota bacterium]